MLTLYLVKAKSTKGHVVGEEGGVSEKIGGKAKERKVASEEKCFGK